MSNTLLVGLAATLLLAAGVSAKPRCARDCANDVRACRAEAKATHDCRPLPGDLKRQCKAALRAARHDCLGIRTICKAASVDDPVCASPSGAFVD